MTNLSEGAEQPAKSWLRDLAGRAKSLSVIIWRHAAAALVVGSVCGLGIWFGLELSKWFLRRESQTLIPGTEIPIDAVALAAIPVTFLFTAWKDILKLLDTLWKYLVNAEKNVSLYPDLLGLFAAAAYLSLTINYFPGKPPDVRAPTVRQAFAVTAPLFFVTDPKETNARVRYFLPFGRTKDASNEKRGDCGSTNMHFASGVQICEVPGYLDHLETVLLSLHACASAANSGPTHIRIVGYADANEFMVDGTDSKSEIINLKLANERAKELAEQVIDVVAKRKLHVKSVVQEWQSHEEMVGDPAYLAAKSVKELQEETGQKLDQGLFNRRADIELVDLAGCKPLVEPKS